MRAGEEMHHLIDLLHSSSMRGTDIRFHMSLGADHQPEEVPYPAMRWRWHTVTAYPWKQEAHINELELNAHGRHEQAQGQISGQVSHQVDARFG